MPERGDTIVLIGFMGTGKSSVGRALAARTGRPCYDTDEMIAARLGLSVPEIFATHGEAAFRDAERETLGQLPTSAAVIVTGGGALLRADQTEIVRGLGIVVQLTADLETLCGRLLDCKTRPLLQTGDPRATIEALLKLREPTYRAAADFSIDTFGLQHDEVVDAILAGVENIRPHVV